MLDQQSVAATAETLRSAERVLASTHKQPDGDAIGSLLAMGLAMEQLNIAYDLVCDDVLPRRYNFLPNAKVVKTEAPRDAGYDLFIALDAADEGRLGMAYSNLEYPIPTIINIDHHITNTNFGQINVIDGQAGSTAEILHNLFISLNIDISTSMAQCLLMGLVTDTLNFSTSGVSAATLRTAANLMDAGADLFEVTTKGYKLQKLSTLMVWQVGLKNMNIENGLLWTTISKEEKQAAGHTGTSSFGLGNFMADVYQAALSAVLVEQEDEEISVGFRCRPPYDVAEIATSLGGGGHRLAAGCTLYGTLAEAEKAVVTQCRTAIDRQRSRNALAGKS